MPEDSEPAGVDELYGLPLEEFTARRNALAKQLRAAKQKEAAARVQGLRKPSITAWAVNQLARRHPDQIEMVLAIGAELRRVHRQALAGDASGLREATRREQEVVGSAARSALALLGEPGGSSSNLDRITETLRTAATESDAGAAVRRGRLEADLESRGFGLTDDAEADTAEPPSTAAPSPVPGDRARADGDAHGAEAEEDGAAGGEAAGLEEARAHVAAAALSAEEARAEAAGLVAGSRRAAERARSRAAQALGRADRVEQEAARAAEAAVAAARRADGARQQAEEAERLATDAEQALGTAEAKLQALGPPPTAVEAVS